MIVLKGILKSELYDHFLTFSVASSILVSPKLAESHRDYASKLLVHFVSQGRRLYGEEFVVYNVHSLLHLADEVQEYGSLDPCAAWPFENYMHELKKLVRSGRRPLSQIVKRLSETPLERQLGMERQATVSTKSPNNGFILANHSCCEVLYPVEAHDEKNVFVCRVYECTQPLFSHPCDSRIRQVYVVDRRHTHLARIPAEQLTTSALQLSLVDTGKIVFEAILHQL